MKFYWVKTHWLIRKIFPNYIWHLPNLKKTVYLTFDDGPTPDITDWTLKILKEYNATATFFCIGANVELYPELFRKIQLDGHAIGNHTYNHFDGWKTANNRYLENIALCEKVLEAFSTEKRTVQKLFRPPYGKLNCKQSKIVLQRGYRIIMWDVLSGDFDTTISPQKCAENVLKNIQSGSIIIFHDSLKASKNLKYALPQTLKYLKENGYEMKAIEFAPAPN